MNQRIKKQLAYNSFSNFMGKNKWSNAQGGLAPDRGGASSGGNNTTSGGNNTTSHWAQPGYLLEMDIILVLLSTTQFMVVWTQMQIILIQAQQMKMEVAPILPMQSMDVLVRLLRILTQMQI